LNRLLSISCLLLAAIIRSHAGDVDPLLQTTGSDFRRTLDSLAEDPDAVARLRASAVSEAGASGLRRELLRRLVLCRADAPDAFASFEELLSMNRPDSPMYPSGWIRDPSMPPLDEQFLKLTQGRWLEQVPAKGEWLNPPADGSAPDAKRLAVRFWPPVAYGLSAEPARLRKWMAPSFSAWCTEGHFGEVELEGLLWLCERTSFDAEVATCYRAMLGMGWGEVPDKEKPRLVARELALFEVNGAFIGPDNRSSIERYLDGAEQFGTPAQAPLLRRVADLPIWSSYRTRMLEVADQVERNGRAAGGR
jgi:hypothetical protein